MVHIPVAAGAINAFHSLPELDMSNHSLNITNCALAGIFAGTLTEWSDPEIAAHNPNLSASIQDKLIRVAVDSGASIATSLFTRYMSSCSSWDGLQTGSSIEWPSHVHKVEGSAGMTAFLRQNAYAIGYLHIHHGHAQGLTEVNLQIGNGSFIDTSAPGPIGNALDYAVDNGVFPAAGDDWDGVHHNLVNVPAPNAWPLMHLQYVYVRADLVSLGNVGTTMTALLRFMLSSKGQTVFRAHGFIGFTEKMKTAALATVDSITVSTTATEWTFEQDAPEVFTGAGEFVFSDFRRNWDADLIEEVRRPPPVLSLHRPAASIAESRVDMKAQGASHRRWTCELTRTHTHARTHARTRVHMCIFYVCATLNTLQSFTDSLISQYNEINGTLTDLQARLAMMQMHHDDFSNQITEHDDAIDNLTTTHTHSLEELSTLLSALQAEYTSMLGMLNTHHSLLEGLHGSNDTFTTLRSDLQTMHDTFYVSELRLKEQMSKVAGVEAQVLQQNQESDSRVEQLAIGGIVLAVISILFNILMVTVYYKNEFSQVSNVKYRTYAESEL